MHTQNTAPAGTAVGAIGIVLSGLTIATGISAAIASGLVPAPWLAGSSLIAVVVIFTPALIKPGSGRWHTPVNTTTARLLLGVGIVIAAAGLTSAMLDLPAIVTVAVAASLAGYTIGTTLTIARLR